MLGLIHPAAHLNDCILSKETPFKLLIQSVLTSSILDTQSQALHGIFQVSKFSLYIYSADSQADCSLILALRAIGSMLLSLRHALYASC